MDYSKKSNPRSEAINLRQLRALRSVAGNGSLAGAARELGQTTPTIHSQIKNLEIAIGRAVLVRPTAGENFSLTPEGEVMLLAAERMSANLSQAVETIESLNAGRLGRVRLAVVSTGKYFAPALVRDLLTSRPEIEIVLRIGNRAEIIAESERARYDLVIMGRPPRSMLGNAVPIGAHPHGIVLPTNNPLGGDDGRDPDRLLKETFIHREQGSGTRVVAERFLERFTRGTPVRTLEMESNETIKQAVIAGLGIAMLSLHTASEELRTGRLTVLKGPGLPIMRHWYLVTPNGKDASPAAIVTANEIVNLSGAFFPKLLPVSDGS